MDQPGWYLPENLEAQEKRELELAARGVLDPESDFSSHYAYLKGINTDLIKPHALTDPAAAAAYAQVIAQALKRRGLSLCGEVLDLGCAVGTITDALAGENPHGRTSGIDLSQSAIAAAQRNHPRCAFFRQRADRLENFPDASLSIIHAREFYPFTRTDDQDYQLMYLKLLSAKLRPGGAVVLQSRRDPDRLEKTIRERATEIAALGLPAISVEPVMGLKTARLFSALSCPPLYGALTGAEMLARKIIGAPLNLLFILAKPR